MNEQLCIQKFNNIGLVAEFFEPQGCIVGGTKRTQDEFLTIFKYKFQICPKDEKWMIEVPGPGQFITTKEADSLSDSFDYVSNYYRDHGWI